MTTIEVQRYTKGIGAAKRDAATALDGLVPLRKAYAEATAERKRLEAETDQARQDVIDFERNPSSSITPERYNEARALLSRSNMMIQLAARRERDAQGALNSAEYKAEKLKRRVYHEAMQAFEDDVAAMRRELQGML